jgi:hypothetical protein
MINKFMLYDIFVLKVMLSNSEISRRLLGGSAGRVTTSTYKSKKYGINIVNKLFIPLPKNRFQEGPTRQEPEPSPAANTPRPPIIPASSIEAKSEEEIANESKLKELNKRAAAVFSVMERRRKLEEKQKNPDIVGKGLIRKKKYNTNYNTTNTTTNTNTNMTTIRKLYAEKYLNIPNTNSGDSILNRLISQYIEVSPQQKKIDDYIEKAIDFNEKQNIEVVRPRAEAPPPARPDEIPISAPQLNIQPPPRPQLEISRPTPPPPPPLPPPRVIEAVSDNRQSQNVSRANGDLLSQIQQGRTLKKAKPSNKPANDKPLSMQDLLKQQLQNRRQSVYSESGGSSHRGGGRANAFVNLFHTRNLYGF